MSFFLLVDGSWNLNLGCILLYTLYIDIDFNLQNDDERGNLLFFSTLVEVN